MEYGTCDTGYTKETAESNEGSQDHRQKIS